MTIVTDYGLGDGDLILTTICMVLVATQLPVQCVLGGYFLGGEVAES